ncbi:L-lactate dehydrogenase, partial [Bacillus cereus]|nr:L-lactate dehydrogenase [Bacillus cereus]
MKKGINRVVLVGTVAVVCIYAFCMIFQGVGEEFVLFVVNEDKYEGDAMVLSHGVAFATAPNRVCKGIFVYFKDDFIV